jgi:hypothetical protein
VTISDETLMAYADGELDAAAREAVESAMREDPRIAARVARHRGLRLQVQAAYAAELSEEVPQRLLAAAQGAVEKGAREKEKGAVAKGALDTERGVVNLRDAVRAAPERGVARRRRWRTMGSLAASVIAGVAVGFLIWGRAGSPFVRGAQGELLARGQLAQALTSQLVAEQSSRSGVLIGLSFLAKSGDYCRTFALAAAVPQSGLACRHGEGWQVRALIQGSGGTDSSTEYRTAGSSMPPAILSLVQSQIAGEPLDPAGERAARQRDWSSAKH